MSEIFDYLNMMNYRLDLAFREPMCLIRNINTAKGIAKNKRCYVTSRTQNWIFVECEDRSTTIIPRIISLEQMVKFLLGIKSLLSLFC